MSSKAQKDEQTENNNDQAQQQQLNENTDDNNQGADQQQQPAQQQEDSGPGVVGKSFDAANQFMTNLFDWRIFGWELFGTALFAHGICASDGSDWFVTISLFAGILLVAPFSGGHLNPAVSLGFLLKDGIVKDSNGNTQWKVREFFGRALAQFLGACLGGFTAFFLLGMSAAPSIPSEDWRMLGGYFTGEAFGTFTFVLTILIMTDDRTKLVDEPQKDEDGQVIERPKGLGLDKLATVATIALGLHFSRAFTYKTGGGLNPGIALGLELWLALDEQSWEPLIHSWLFIVGPCLGAALAAFYYGTFHIAATNSSGCFDPANDVKAEKQQQQEQDQQQQEESGNVVTNNDENA